MCSLPYVVWPPNSGKRKQVGNLSWGLSALPSPSCPGHLGPRQGSPGAKPHPPARVLFSRPLNFTAQGPEFSVFLSTTPRPRHRIRAGGGRGERERERERAPPFRLLGAKGELETPWEAKARGPRVPRPHLACASGACPRCPDQQPGRLTLCCLLSSVRVLAGAGPTPGPPSATQPPTQSPESRKPQRMTPGLPLLH